MKKRVHIVPVGFERDRIVEPLRFRIPDKVYLLVNSSDKTKVPENDFFFELVWNLIKKIKDTIEIERVPVDIYNFPDLWNQFNRLIVSEVMAGNEVYVNLSSGNKISAVAAMQAVQMFGKGNAFAYYVVPENYKSSVKFTKKYRDAIGLDKIDVAKVSKLVEDENLIMIPRYPIQVPDSRWILTLKLIESAGGEISQLDLKKQLQDKVIKMKAIRNNENDIVVQEGQIIPPDQIGKNKRFQQYFIANITTPMKDKGWILSDPVKGKRKRFKITEEGKRALKEFDGVF